MGFTHFEQAFFIIVKKPVQKGEVRWDQLEASQSIAVPQFFSLFYCSAFKCQTQCEERAAFPWEFQCMVELSVLLTSPQVYKGHLASVNRKTGTMISERNLYTVNITNVIYLLSALL